MNEARTLPRSPDLMSPADTALLVVDMQEKLLPLITGHAAVSWNVRRLIDGAAALGVTVLATEQYPKGLGATVAPLRERLGPLPEKLTFSCGGCQGLFQGLAERGIHKILIAGIEAHVCVAQTALDLMADGWRVYIAADAVGSRRGPDCEIALRRLESSGATLTTTEAALFEWCERAGTEPFRQISRLAKETPPLPS